MTAQPAPDGRTVTATAARLASAAPRTVEIRTADTEHTAPARPAGSTRSAERLLGAIRVLLVIALSALVLTIGALAYVVSFEAIRAFAIQTGAFPAVLAWTAPLLVDSFTTAATLVILWRYLRGEPWYTAWYAWTLVVVATTVSVALNVGHAPHHLAARLLAALPSIALVGAVELLMSVVRCGLRAATAPPGPDPVQTTRPAVRTVDPTNNGHALTAARQRITRAAVARTAGNHRASSGGARAQVRELVIQERGGGPRVTVAQVIAATGLKERRAYELLRDARAD